MDDYLHLPADLPEPTDDGAAAHLPGRRLPSLSLVSTDGNSVTLSALGPGRTVVFVYPLTGRPGTALPKGWDSIPGARGSTPTTCSSPTSSDGSTTPSRSTPPPSPEAGGRP